MRYLALCALMLLCAALMACSSPAQVARRSIDATTRSVQAAEAGFKTLTPLALEALVQEERAKRAAELAEMKCPAPPAAQPQPCEIAAGNARTRYEARIADFRGKASKVDAAFGAAYGALLLAVVVVSEVEAGVRPETGLAGLLPRLAAVLKDALDAYGAFKLFAGSFGALPGWIP